MSAEGRQSLKQLLSMAVFYQETSRWCFFDNLKVPKCRVSFRASASFSNRLMVEKVQKIAAKGIHVADKRHAGLPVFCRAERTDGPAAVLLWIGLCDY